MVARVRKALSGGPWLLPVGAVCWVLLLGVLAVIREAHPFRLASDDFPYHKVAEHASLRATTALSSSGLWVAASEFVSALSADLPVRANRSRPLVVWVWSVGYLIGGDQGVVWTWRILFLLMLLALLVFAARISSWFAAGVVTGIVAVAPVTQGLLAWMSCAGYLLVCLLTLLAARVTVVGRSSVATVFGILLSALAVLSRESGYVLIPCFAAFCAWRGGRRRLSGILLLLPLVLWLLVRPDPHSALGRAWSDPALASRSALLILGGTAASIVRNVGLLVLLALLGATWPFRRWLLGIVVVLSLASSHFQLVLPLLLVLTAVHTARDSSLGLVWTVVTTGVVILLGHFLSRYAFEPLVGLSLAVAPAIHSHFGRARRLALIPFVLWHTGTSLYPDALHESAILREFSFRLDQRYSALGLITRMRTAEWVTFAGRTGGDWDLLDQATLVYGRDRVAPAPIWRADGYWRGGAALGLHRPGATHVVFDREKIWDWTGWHWALRPPSKPWGVHVNLPGEGWSVHPRSRPRNHRRCLRVVGGRISVPATQRSEAITLWLERVPELNDTTAAAQWLSEVWEIEEGCSLSLELPTFQELALGRMLLRDDGWLDVTERAWLITRLRQRKET